MSSRSIFVELGLRADNFKREAASAAQALGGVASAGDKSASKLSGGFERAERNIADARAATTTLGAGLAATGVAMLGVTTAVAKTGIEYNTLQQSSRAAMTVIMGSAKAANAQMDKLDAFARTSPFSKQVFIQAQQQLASFGVEASKIVPIMDAVQQSVAAMGGTNTDIAQIVDVFAKIQSQGKITARELMQLGVHGIDAASLIGEAMGKTGNQIREEISAGAIDADMALTALTDGMQNRFGGAADAVKNTMVGALDRVKAAFRDFSASAMEPFVSMEGGGLLVGWTNTLADTIRQLDKLPGPVKTGAAVMTGLGGAAATAAGSFLLLAPRILDTHTALWELATNPATGDGVLGKMASGLLSLKGAAPLAGAAVGALAVGLGIYADHAANAQARTDSYVAALNDLEGSASSVEEAIARVATQNAITGDHLDWGWVQWANADFKSFDEVLGRAGISYAEFGQAVAGSADDQEAMLRRMRIARNEGKLSQGMYDELVIKFSQQVEAAQEAERQYQDTEDAAAELADGQSDLAAASEEAAAAAEQASAAYEGYLSALQGLQSYQDGLVNSFLAGRDAQREWDAATAAFAETAEHSEETLDAYAATARKSIMTMLEARDANGERIYSEEQLVAMMQQSRDMIMNVAMAMGASREEAEALADSYGLIPEEVVSRIILDEAEARAALAEIEEALGGLPPEVATLILALGGDQAVAVAGAVEDALERGVPPEKIVDVIAEDSATGVILPIDQRIRDIPPEWITDILANDKSSAKSQTVKRNVDAIPTSKSTTITAIDNASGALGWIRSQLASIQSKTVTVTTLHSGTTAGGRQVRALGGPVFGPGTSTSDSIPVWMSNNEHVITSAEVDAVGGHGAVFALRSMMKSGDLKRMMGFAEGGSPAMVSRPVMVPQPPRAAQTVSFKNMEITGRLSFDKSGLVSIIDGRVVKYV